MAEGISVRLTAVPTGGPPIRVPDVKDATDFAGYAIPGPLLVPVPGSVDVEYTSRVATSLEAGGIKNLVDAGQITVEFILSATFLAAVGGGTGSVVYTADEAPIGVIDGFNVNFTLAAVPVTFVGLYLNGQKIVRGGVDYSIAGSAITMVIPPGSGESLRADYLTSSTGVVFEVDEAPAGAIDDFNVTFITAFLPITFIGLYLNGEKQVGGGVDYSVLLDTPIGQSTITMNVAPLVGDTLLVDYIR